MLIIGKNNTINKSLCLTRQLTKGLISIIFKILSIALLTELYELFLIFNIQWMHRFEFFLLEKWSVNRVGIIEIIKHGIILIEEQRF